MRLPRLATLVLLTSPLFAPLILSAQNYQSYMNGVERARESSRYESALLEGTYNNPMLRRSEVQVPDWGAMARRREEAEQEERQRAQWEQQRAAYFQREAEAEAQRRQAAWQADQERRAATRREEERRAAQQIAQAWGMVNVYAAERYREPDRLLRGGEVARIPSRLLYGAAAMRVFESPNDYDVSLAVQAASRALAEGQVLPAVLLAEPALREESFLSLLARHGVEHDRDLTLDYTLYFMPTAQEVRNLRFYGQGRPAQHEAFEQLPLRLKALREQARCEDWRSAVFKSLQAGALLPWEPRPARVDHESLQALRTLRELRPGFGHFITALFEERLRYDASRPSPWADFLFTRAAQLSESRFVKAFVARREALVRQGDRELLKQWRSWRLKTPRDQLDSGADRLALFRLAGRLVLGHGLPEFGELLDDAGIPQIGLNLRRGLAHELLSELSRRRMPEAIALQYLAALQEPDVRSPSLLAYANAFHWLMDWDDPPVALRSTVLQAASYLEAAPVTQYSWFYPGGLRAAATGFSLSVEGLRPYTMLAFSSSYSYSAYTEEHLKSLPLLTALYPVVARLRGRLADEGGALFGLCSKVDGNDFQARFSLWMLRDCAQELGDQARLDYIDLKLRELPPELPEALSTLGQAELWGSLNEFVEAARTESGAALLRRTLRLEAAESSAQHLDAVALRNLVCKPLVPAARVLPLGVDGQKRLRQMAPALRHVVAVQALDSLDESLATQALLPLPLLLEWLREGAAAGDGASRLRLAQLVLNQSVLARSAAPELTPAHAAAELDALVSAGQPGALEFRYEHRRKAGLEPAPLDFGPSLAAALRRNSPLAAQAWLDSLPSGQERSPELAALEARALVISAADLRTRSTGRWWKSLCTWSAYLREHRGLLTDPAAAVYSEQIAASLSDLLRQREGARLFFDTEHVEPTDQGVFVHLAYASASLLPGEEASSLRYLLMSATSMRSMLALRSGLPLDQALYELRTQPEGPRRSHAVFDAVRWYAIDTTSMHGDAGVLILDALPTDARTHPLWERMVEHEFVSRLLTQFPTGTAPDPALQLRRQSRLLSLVRGHLGAGEEFEQAHLLEALESYSDKARWNASLRAAPDWAELFPLLEDLRLRVERVAPHCDLVLANMGGNAAVVRSARRLLEAGEWDALRRLDCGQLLASEQLEILLCVPALEEERLRGSVDFVLSRAWFPLPKVGRTLSPEEASRGAATLRAIATRWLDFTPSEQLDWRLACFSFVVQAELLAPHTETTLAFLQKLAALGQSVVASPRAREGFMALREDALARRNLPLLKALAVFSEELVSEQIDELEGWPRRKAAEQAQALFDSRLERVFAFLDAGREGPLCARVIARLLQDEVRLNDYAVLRAAKALCPSFPTQLLPKEQALRVVQVRLLEYGSSGWDADDTVAELARELEPLARALWQARTTWADKEPARLYWLVRSYADMDFAWAKEARRLLATKPTPLVHWLLCRDGRDVGVPIAPIDEALAASPPYAEARRRLESDPYSDEPYAEFDALPAVRP